MKLLKITAAIFIFLFFASCYKYKVVDLNPTGSGSGSGNGSTNCKECSYFPTCSGTRYITNDTTFGGAITPNRKDSLLFIKDTVIDGLSCRKLLYTSSNSYTYYNCTNGTTTLFAINVVSAGGTSASKIKRVLLKASSPVGTTWTDSLNSGTSTTLYKSTIIDKGLTITINGKIYSNVIKVEVETGANVPGSGYFATTLQTMYYANNIGLIYNNTEDLFSGTILQSNGLVSYYIP